MIGDRDWFKKILFEELPAGWFPEDGTNITALLQAMAEGAVLNFEQIKFIEDQTRLATSTGIFLEFWSQDLFGVDTLPRREGELDPDYRARIQLELLRKRGTREAIANAVFDLTGAYPEIFEPAHMADSGIWTTLTDEWLAASNAFIAPINIEEDFSNAGVFALTVPPGVDRMEVVIHSPGGDGSHSRGGGGGGASEKTYVVEPGQIYSNFQVGQRSLPAGDANAITSFGAMSATPGQHGVDGGAGGVGSGGDLNGTGGHGANGIAFAPVTPVNGEMVSWYGPGGGGAATIFGDGFPGVRPTANVAFDTGFGGIGGGTVGGGVSGEWSNTAITNGENNSNGGGGGPGGYFAGEWSNGALANVTVALSAADGGFPSGGGGSLYTGNSSPFGTMALNGLGGEGAIFVRLYNSNATELPTIGDRPNSHGFWWGGGMWGSQSEEYQFLISASRPSNVGTPRIAGWTDLAATISMPGGWGVGRLAWGENEQKGGYIDGDIFSTVRNNRPIAVQGWVRISNPATNAAVPPNRPPVWTTPAGSLGIYSGNTTVNIGLHAIDPEGSVVTYFINDGALPDGLSLSSTGRITGTLPMSNADVTASFTVRASDPLNSFADRIFTLTTLHANFPPVWVTNTALPDMQVAIPMDMFFEADDPELQPVTYNVTAGGIPPGLLLNPFTGELSGTPLLTGPVSFTLSADDGHGAASTRTFHGTVAQGFSIFVGSNSAVNQANAVIGLPVGTQPNHTAIVFVPNLDGLNPALDNTWRENRVLHSDNNYTGAVYVKTIGVTELANSAITVRSGGDCAVQLLVYNTISDAVVRAVVEGPNANATTLDYGIPPFGSHYMGAVVLATERDITGNLVPPTGFVEREEQIGTYFRSMSADHLAPYSGAALTVTGFSSSFYNVGFVLELINFQSLGFIESTPSLPAMTSNSTPTGYTAFGANVSSTTDVWQAFDATPNGTPIGNGTAYPQIFSRGYANATVIGSYAFNLGAGAGLFEPYNWTFEGSNDATNWTPLDFQNAGSYGWPASNIYRTFQVPRAYWLPFTHHRIRITKANAPYSIQDILFLKGDPGTGPGSNEPPIWSTAAALGSYNANTAIHIGLVATDPNNDAVSYALDAGEHLPSGLSLLANGLITGNTGVVVSDTMATFVVNASDTFGEFVGRQFTMTLNHSELAPVWVTDSFLGIFQVNVAITPITLQATDYDSLTFTVSGGSSLPSGLSLANTGVLSGTPSVPGAYSFNLTVSDGINNVQKLFTANVAAHVPVWTTNSGVIGSGDEHTAFSFNLVADGFGLPVTYTLANSTTLPSPLTLASNGLVSGNLPNVTSNTGFNFTVAANTSVAAAFRDFEIDVVDVPKAPVWVTNAGVILSANENAAVNAAVVASDSDHFEIVYTQTAGTIPSTVTLQSNGALTGALPQVGANAAYSFEITATSNVGSSARTFEIDVIDVPQAPIWTTLSGALATGNEGDFISVFVSAFDVDGHTVTYTLANSTTLPSGISLDGNTGSISGTLPGVGSTTVTSFDVKASSIDGFSFRTFTITDVDVPAPNPVWTTAGGDIWTGNEGTTVNTNVVATIANGLTLTYSLVNGTTLPSGVSLASNGHVSGSLPRITSNTTTSVDVRVTSNATTSADRTFTLTDINVPQAPTWATTAGLLFTQVENTAVSFALVAGDIDGLTVTYTLANATTLPSGVSLLSNGLVTGTLGNVVANTTSNFSVTATSADGSADRAFSIRTIDNPVPVWVTNAGSIASSNEGSIVNTSVVATDPFGRAVTYSLVNSTTLPGTMTFFSNGLITGAMPRVTANTAYSIDVQANNSVRTSDRTFTLTSRNVLAAPTWVSNAGNLLDAEISTSANVTVVALGHDSAAVVYAVANATTLPSGMALDTSTGVISGTMPATPAIYSFVISATSEGFTIYRSFSITAQTRVMAFVGGSANVQPNGVINTYSLPLPVGTSAGNYLVATGFSGNGHNPTIDGAVSLNITFPGAGGVGIQMVSYKQLTSGDISNGLVTLSNAVQMDSNVTVSVYDVGPDPVTVALIGNAYVNFANSTANAFVVPFTGGNSTTVVGRVGLAVEAQKFSKRITEPTGYVMREQGNNVTYRSAIADDLLLPPDANGTQIWMGNAVSSKGVAVLEFRK